MELRSHESLILETFFFSYQSLLMKMKKTFGRNALLKYFAENISSALISNIDM